MKLYGAFYRTLKGGWIDWAIGLRTWSHHSHCELVFSHWETGGRIINPICFSSSPMDGGTRFKAIDVYGPKWDILPIYNVNVEQVHQFCLNEANCKYDWNGVWAYNIPGIARQSTTKWFCSEVCSAAVLQGGVILPRRPHLMTPKHFRQLLVRRLAGLPIK